MSIFRRDITRVAGLALSAALFIGLAAPMQAAPTEPVFVVLNSTVGALPVKTEIAPNSNVALGDGDALRLLAPNGATRELRGPYEGPVDGGDVTANRAETVFGAIYAAIFGGVDDTSPTATRNSALLVDDWPYTATDRESVIQTHCWTGGAPVLRRVETGRDLSGTIRSMDVGERMQLSLPAGQAEFVWPAEPSNGERYRIVLDTGESLNLRFVRVPSDVLTDGPEQLARLVSASCDAQARALAAAPMLR